MKFEIAARRPRTTLSEEEARRGVIRHYVPSGVMDGTDDASPEYPCAWCGQPTKVLAETPFRPDLGRIPLMLTCGMELRDAWRMHQAGEPLPLEYQVGVARLAGQRRLEG